MTYDFAQTFGRWLIFNEVLNDPYSLKFVRRTNAEVHYSCRDSKPCWRIGVKYRAKNTYGAYVLTEDTFEIRNNKVIYRIEGTILSAIQLPKEVSVARPITVNTRGIQLVKAQSGDTVAKIAARFGVPAIEVAKFNGLSNAVNSPLPAGREIRILSR